MKLLYKLEEKFGKFAIPNLPIITIAIFGFSYLVSFAAPNVSEMMMFSPTAIFGRHEFWRLITWIFTPPGDFDYFTLLMLVIYAMLGRSIERAIGTFMYNMYILGTMFAIFIVNLITGAIFYAQNVAGLAPEDMDFFVVYDYMRGTILMTYFLMYTIFLGFALIYSESIMLVFFVIPMKAKYIAYIDLIWLAYEFYRCPIHGRVTILAVVGVWLILVFAMNKYKPGHVRIYMKHKTDQIKRKTAARRNTPKGAGEPIPFPTTITKHKCAICGRSEKDDPMLEFRFCSKCNGNYEYCMDHLYTHEHVK